MKSFKLKDILIEAEVFSADDVDQEDPSSSRAIEKLKTKFEGPVGSIIDLIKTKEDLNTAVSMLITKSEETTSGLGRKSKSLLLKTVRDL